jgi:hypothetical protein
VYRKSVEQVFDPSFLLMATCMSCNLNIYMMCMVFTNLVVDNVIMQDFWYSR